MKWVVLFFLPAAVWADVHVGDTTVNSLIVTSNDGVARKGTNTTIVTAVDTAGDQIHFDQRVSLNGEDYREGGVYTLSQHHQFKERLKDLAKFCAAEGGELEKVTVPAGTFDTCKRGFIGKDQRGYQWFADVGLLSIVKEVDVSADGARADLEIISVK